ncbi:hypothetical protein [Cetobacterium sp.]|uniref:hypothetical protein n=1 Tax=Cetobacterium sp. TaxID=2071632 RepID=UPI003F407CE1
MIKVPNGLEKEFEELLKVKHRLEAFQNSEDLNKYLSNVDRKNIENRNIDVIFSNLKNNTIFKYSDKKIKDNIKEILFLGNSYKNLSRGEVFKLYLYLYENEAENEKIEFMIEKYSENNIKVTKESFIEFMIKESEILYTKWTFPIEIKIKYKIFEDVVKKLENPDVFKKLSPILIELGRYIDMEVLSKELRGNIKKEMLSRSPSEVKYFFKKYNRLDFEKIERIDNIIFIFLKGKDIISLTKTKNKNMRIELLNKNRYYRIMESEIETSEKRLKEKKTLYECKNFKEVAKKLYLSGYDIKWIEIDTTLKIIGIVLGILLVLVMLGILGYIGYYYIFK